MSVKQLIDIDELRENFQQGKITCYGMTIQEIMNLKKENEEVKTIILKIISSKEIGYTVKDKMNDITMICRFGIDDLFRKIRGFLFEK